MWEYMERRAVRCAEYILETNATVRECAAHFNISKSTVHKDVSERLKMLSPTLYEQCRAVLDRNKQERHIRGGMATKHKYEETRLH